jgi:large subunit ribosomal protein L9e
MKLVFAHFPINAIISKDKCQIEIKNFLGGKKGHLIKLYPGCTVELSKDVQNELIFDGIDNQTLSLCCSQVAQVCKIGTKDERKFLDGIFVAEKTVIQPLED